MNDAKNELDRSEAEVTSEAPYEAPQVESVLTADDLAREVQYAGTISNPV